MWYILECPLLLNENGEALMEVHNYFELGSVWDWSDGLPLEEDEKDFSIPIKIDFEPHRGYQGPPPEFDDLGIPVMSNRLSKVLIDSGIDNIDFFPTILTNTETGQTYEYMTFKLVGLVPLLDLGKSEYKSYDGKVHGDVSIYNMVVDEAIESELLMFRLAEDISAIVVHDKIKKSIQAAGIETLQFVLPEDYVQI